MGFVLRRKLMRRGCPENTGKDVEKNPEKRFTGPGTSAILATIKGSKGQSAGPGPCRLLHGSVNTVEIPDAMCSLETFVTDMVLWQGSFFLLQRQDRKEAMNEHEFLECIRQSLFQFWKSDLADGRDVGDRCAAHLPCIAKKMEPSLLLPMGFGAILVNLPLSGAITQGDTVGPISALFEAGMSNELFPLLLFIGIGAMIDFGPLLEKPWLMLFGAAAQFGIFFTLFLAGFFFDLKDAAPSLSSVRQTAPPPFSWPIRSTPSTSVPSWWQPTATWRWCPSCSRP